jgi:predicted unusual protein kinase regulating ubiquinone biosynthesis (AarF/ABC1/UbiB family)
VVQESADRPADRPPQRRPVTGAVTSDLLPNLPDEVVKAEAPEPQPFALRPPSADHLRRRGVRTAQVLRRRLGPTAVNRALGRPLRPEQVAPQVRKAFGELGATYVKLGQLVASAPSVFGPEISDEFRSLLDDGRPVRFDLIHDEVVRSTGKPLKEVFRSFEPDPIGKASMAVVHRAELLDGTPVAVKVLRPGIERKVAADFAMLKWVLPLWAKRIGDGRGDAMEPLVEGLRTQLREELDLRNEARIMDHFNELLRHVELPSIAIPHTYPELSSRRVLVMEYLDGVPIDDLRAIEEHGIDPTPLVTDIVKAFFLTAMRFGIFHGDVHAGNLLLLKDGRIGVLDWGIVGRLDEENREHFRDIIRAALGDEEAWDRVTDRITDQIGPLIKYRLGITDEQIAPIIRSVLEPMFTKPFSEVKLSTLLLGPEELAGTTPAAPTADDPDAPPPPTLDHFERDMMLLAKQLLYFERYGQLYLRDLSLMSDREFFEALVEAPEAPENDEHE